MLNLSRIPEFWIRTFDPPPARTANGTGRPFLLQRSWPTDTDQRTHLSPKPAVSSAPAQRARDHIHWSRGHSRLPVGSPSSWSVDSAVAIGIRGEAVACHVPFSRLVTATTP